jgi:hypothetical protein
MKQIPGFMNFDHVAGMDSIQLEGFAAGVILDRHKAAS